MNIGKVEHLFAEFAKEMMSNNEGISPNVVNAFFKTLNEQEQDVEEEEAVGEYIKKLKDDEYENHIKKICKEYNIKRNTKTGSVLWVLYKSDRGWNKEELANKIEQYYDNNLYDLAKQIHVACRRLEEKNLIDISSTKPYIYYKKGLVNKEIQDCMPQKYSYMG